MQSTFDITEQDAIRVTSKGGLGSLGYSLRGPGTAGGEGDCNEATIVEYTEHGGPRNE